MAGAAAPTNEVFVSVGGAGTGPALEEGSGACVWTSASAAGARRARLGVV